METMQLTLPFAAAPAPLFLEFPFRQSERELAAARGAKFSARRRRARFGGRRDLNRPPAFAARPFARAVN